MSGIVGIINTDGAPVSNAVLKQLLASIAYRGPHAQNIWLQDEAGLGHTLLRFTDEANNEQQPCSLDGEVWICADARVDGRAELRGKLTNCGRLGLETASDAELILHAYHAWGDECLQHLIGDFSFLIWDAHTHRAFCGRDHFGVKPFYYAQVSNHLLLSNTLNCIRFHPGVSDKLNETAIGDFLILDRNQDPATTFFSDVHRLPAAHYLTWSKKEGLRIRRYWTLARNGCVRYSQEEDYVENFKQLLESAVSDRLRSTTVAVYMSGGLDSTTVAATANAVLCRKSSSFDLRAHTIVYDHLIRDTERYYSGLVATALNIPIIYHEADNYRLYEGWDRPGMQMPEPLNDPLTAISLDSAREISMQSRIALAGLGVDALLAFPMEQHILSQLKRRNFSGATRALWRYLALHRRLPPLKLRMRINRWRGNEIDRNLYPCWLNRSFAKRMNLQVRWQQECDKALNQFTHSPAYTLTADPYWQDWFEHWDAGVTRSPLDISYPFFDVRLVSYVLALPQVPWCINKYLLRKAISEMIPEEVRSRPKSPLRNSPVYEHAKTFGIQRLFDFEPVPELKEYVDMNAFARAARAKDVQQFWINLRCLSLNRWLKGLASSQPGLVDQKLEEAD